MTRSSPGADGRPDFAGERFIYLGDQANMPYGNYPAQGHEDYLRELVVKDVVFLLGKRYHAPGEGGALSVRMDKPPVKALVIACNTATAYGLDDVCAAQRRWGLPVLVVGVVEAGAAGSSILKARARWAFWPRWAPVPVRFIPGRLAHVRTGGAETARGHAVGQWRLAGVIEGDPAFATPLGEQVAADVRARWSAPGTRCRRRWARRCRCKRSYWAARTSRLQPRSWMRPSRPCASNRTLHRGLRPGVSSSTQRSGQRELFREMALVRLRRAGKAANRRRSDELPGRCSNELPFRLTPRGGASSLCVNGTVSCGRRGG